MSGNGSARRRPGINSMLVMVTAIAVVMGAYVRPAVAAGDDGGVIGLVSHSSLDPSTAAAGRSDEAITSADGGVVVFTSTAGDLVAGQNDGTGDADADVFLFERVTGTTTLVSHVPGGPATAANGASGRPSVSADGAWVAFVSEATDLVAGQSDTNHATDIFLFERATGTVTLVSHSLGGATTTANSESFDAPISGNGAFVSFVSAATDLVAGQTDANGTHDVFLFERATATVTLVSHTSASTTTTPNSASSAPAISADAGFVVFSSSATNVVGGQVDSAIPSTDAFLFRRATNAVTLVSHRQGSLVGTGNGPSAPDLVSDTGLVIFRSTSTNLVAGQVDFPDGMDVFLFDGATNAVTLVSHAATSTTTAADGPSAEASMSDDGAFVAFQSFATNLVAGQSDSNSNFDVFLFERATGAVTLVSHIPGSATTAANDESTDPSVNGDGAVIAFRSLATDLVPDQIDVASTEDVFLSERVAGTVSLVSHRPGAVTTAGNGNSTAPVISASGTFVTFVSLATDLVAGQVDANLASDVFLFARSVPPAETHVDVDVDGDGDTDTSVYRPADGVWFFQDGPTLAWGTSGDIPVPGDYDGDGDADVAVFRPSTGVWFVQGGPAVAWGTGEDLPVPADYDGDGDTDVAVFRPSTGTWFVHGGPTVTFGTSGDIPVPGDFDGDGDADIAVFRPSSGLWFVHGGTIAAWGTSGDIPVPGDYDGDGAEDLAVFRPATGTWFVEGGPTLAWGTSGDIPVPGDYDGDGDTDIAVFRPSTGIWFQAAGGTLPFGTSGDVPLPLPDAIRRFFFPPL